MLRRFLIVTLLSMVAVETQAKPKQKVDGPLVELPTFVVHGFRIPSSWLEVSYECKGPLPIDRVKKAWLSKVGRGTPAEAAGLKTGDILWSFDHQPIDTMTGYSLGISLKKERESGTRLEMIVQTANEEKRTVAILFK